MYQILYYSYSLFILLITQIPILVFTQQTQYVSKSQPPSIIAAPMSPISYNTDESVDESDADNSDGDIYDDEDNYNSPSTAFSQSKLNKTDEYDDEGSSNLDENEIEDESENYPGKMSVDRFQQKHPMNDSNIKKPIDTFRIPLAPADLWRDLLSKPAVLVGVIGGIIIGMLTSILLIMFIIYRMRKRDEGSYVLDDGPRKSPSHAYTRVSSREFFA